VTSKCYECGGVLHAKHQDYRYTECGLQNVILKNLFVYVSDDCGAEVPEIPSIGSLHRSIAMDLLTKRTLLCGEEVKFLRKMARMTGVQLSQLMGVTSTQVSKWENNKRSIGASNDRVLRLICYAGVLERIVKIDSGLKGEMAKVASKVPSLDIRDLLKGIEGKSKGPKRVTIDPAELTNLGNESALGASAAETRIQ
jgi:DNA-binding transcriptional regulator YiaG